MYKPIFIISIVVLAYRTAACSIIDYCHDIAVGLSVCLSVRPSVTRCIVALTVGVEG